MVYGLGIFIGDVDMLMRWLVVIVVIVNGLVMVYWFCVECVWKFF